MSLVYFIKAPGFPKYTSEYARRSDFPPNPPILCNPFIHEARIDVFVFFSRFALGPRLINLERVSSRAASSSVSDCPLAKSTAIQNWPASSRS